MLNEVADIHSAMTFGRNSEVTVREFGDADREEPGDKIGIHPFPRSQGGGVAGDVIA
jgi:hypothetical protein